MAVNPEIEHPAATTTTAATKINITTATTTTTAPSCCAAAVCGVAYQVSYTHCTRSSSSSIGCIAPHHQRTRSTAGGAAKTIYMEVAPTFSQAPAAAAALTTATTTTTTSPAYSTHFLHHQYHQQHQQHQQHQPKRAISSPRSVLAAWSDIPTTTTTTTTTTDTMATGFPAPEWNRGHRVSPSPFVAPPGSNEQGGFMLASASSGRRWHVIDTVRPCLYGSVLKAVEVSSSPFSGDWGPPEQRYFAIKVCVCSI